MRTFRETATLQRHRKKFFFLAVAVIGAVSFPGSTQARTLAQKKQLARVEFERAQEMQAELDGRPQLGRTVQEYERAADAYRRVYLTAPVFSKADASAFAAAELLAQAGRELHNKHEAQASIAQYEYLCREYPGSKFRTQALFSIGEIYRDILGDNAKSQATFEKFLQFYPHNRLAEPARTALAQLASGTGKPAGPVIEDQPVTPGTTPQPSSDSALESKPSRDRGNPQPAPDDSDQSSPAEQTSTPAAALRRQRKQLTLVTGVRDWSTPDYTRVAIDIDDEVKYEAGRVPSPDRIFFDLQSTKLAADLAGKTLEVGDGFLKKIRIAQFKTDMTRVVLEVDPVADYSAFLLPNPYRLIIDIHGKLPANSAAQPGAKESKQPTVANSVAAPPSPLHLADPSSAAIASPSPVGRNDTAAAQQTTQIKQVPSLPAPASILGPTADAGASSAKSDGGNKAGQLLPVREPAPDASTSDIADLADLTNNMGEAKATPKPTSGPVVQSIAPRSGAPAKASAETKPAAQNSAASNRPASVAASREALPTAAGDRSLTRILGLKIGKIVIDAGHGGHDTGTIGPNGLLEKDLVLDVALRLGKLLDSKLGAEVVYTRDDDTFVPLETRTAIANKAEADLFISIHANSSHDASARGVESYYLNFTDSPSAMEVAARENAVSEKSIHELQDLVKKIALKEKIEESREFAADVQDELYADFAAKTGMRNRGVKKAPFIVLIGANMPSILTEISFVSNPRDEKRLKTPEYRERIAEALCQGVAKYVSGLSGIKLAATNAAPKQLAASN